MKSNIKYLLVLFLLLLIISYFVLKNKETQVDKNTVFLIPELKTQINDVDQIVLSKNDKKISLSKTAGIWRIEESNNYLADANQIANLLLDLRKLKLKERKTSKPENFAKLSLAESGDYAATQLILKNSNQQFADILIGKKSQNSQGIFVRKRDEKYAWLSEGSIKLNLDPSNWIVTTIIDINSSEIKSVTFGSNDESFTVDKITPQDADFGLVDIPDNMQFKSTININDLANGLQKFNIESAFERDDSLVEPILEVNYQLFSGMQYQLYVSNINEKYYLNIDLINADSATENDKELENWTYVIAKYKFDALNKKLSDLIEPVSVNEDRVSEPNTDD